MSRQPAPVPSVGQEALGAHAAGVREAVGTARPPLPPGPYLVAGLGRAGRAAAAALVELAGPEQVTAWDQHDTGAVVRELRRLGSLGGRVWTGDFSRALDADPPPASLVKSPGIAPHAPVIEAARARGISVLDELELGWRLGTSPVVGVTGTNGKSTVAHLIARCLEFAGRSAVVTGNVQLGAPYSGAAEPEEGWVICEVSSFQLESSPSFLPEVGVFTNLSHDHLDRHRDMAGYADCKRRMFVRGGRCTPLAVTNVDDPLGRRLAEEVAERGGRVLGYGIGPDAGYRVRALSSDVRSGTVEIEGPRGSLVLKSRLTGAHNALNLAAALAAADGLGLDEGIVVAALSSAPGAPGRFERIEAGQAFDAIVDFAHNPDAIRRTLLTARESLRARPGRRLLTVVSSAGGVDRTKRPAMGEAASELADVVVLTSGNRRGEPAESSIADLLEGARRNASRIETEPDRRAAIKRTVELAEPGDILLVLGRGPMRQLVITPDGTGPPFDDREVLREALRGT